MSSKNSPATLGEFEGANSILEVTDSTGFFFSVTKSLGVLYPVRFRGVLAVAYKDRIEEWNGLDWGQNPALIKEVRAKVPAVSNL